MKIRKKTALIFIVLCFTLLFSMSAFADKYTGTKKGGGTIRLILVGDSRVMHMSQRDASYTKNVYFVYGNGCSARDLNENFDGFRTKLQNALNTYRNASVVFMLGVNGNANPGDNMSQLRRAYDYFMNRYGGRRYVISTVGKTVGRTGSYANSHVTALNEKILSVYSGRVEIFDLYGLTGGLGKSDTIDGLHYKSGVYIRILKKVKAYSSSVADPAPVQPVHREYTYAYLNPEEHPEYFELTDSGDYIYCGP